MPSSACAPRFSTTNSPETSRCTASVISTVPGAATACTRAAILGPCLHSHPRPPRPNRCRLAPTVSDAPSSGAAHCAQNFASEIFSCAHFGHGLPSGVAHWLQNRDPAALSVPHFEQRMDFPPGNRRSNLFYHPPSGRDNKRSFQFALSQKLMGALLSAPPFAALIPDSIQSTLRRAAPAALAYLPSARPANWPGRVPALSISSARPAWSAPG